MNAREIQCGDLVSVDGKPVRVYGVMARMNRIYDTMTNDISLKRCAPIFLTREILEKNLEKENEDSVDGCWYFNIENSKIWGILDDDAFYLNFNGQQDMIPIHYVNELQRALRLCGLTDVADNFKV